MSTAAAQVASDERTQQGFPIRWSDSPVGANVRADGPGEVVYGRVSEDAAEDDVAQDYLDAFDAGLAERAGSVTVEVWRLDEDGQKIAGTKTVATAWHDHRGVRVTEDTKVREVTASWEDAATGLVHLEARIGGVGFGANLYVEARETASGQDGWSRVGDVGPEMSSEYGPFAGGIADEMIAQIKRIGVP